MRSSLALLLAPLVLLSACASMEEMQRDYAAKTCNRETGYERGHNDGAENKPMDSSFANGCEGTARREVMQGYREGYDSARNEGSIDADENGIHVHGGGMNIHLGKKNGKRWVCEVEAFGQTFSGFGASRGEAAQEARRQCEVKYHAMHCDQPSCEEAQ